MTCPRCSNELRAQNKDGIEIDVCRQCGGVWLDRGELDRLTAAEDRYYGDDDDDDDDNDDGRGGRGGRKRGFFQNLMDNIGNLGD
jgi:Zn-finger nucleic acid-binding protein